MQIFLVFVAICLSYGYGQQQQSLNDCIVESRNERYSLGQRWTHRCVTYLCEGYGSYRPISKGCADSRGTCHSVGERWTEGCNELECMESITQTEHKLFPNPVKKGCLYGGQCKDVGWSWTVDCITYSCLDSTHGAYYKAVQPACQRPFVTGPGRCVPLNSTWQQGCVKFQCVQENKYIKSKIITGGCRDVGGKCHVEFSKWTNPDTCAQLTCVDTHQNRQHTYTTVLSKRACKDDQTGQCHPLYSNNLVKQIRGQLYRQCSCYPTGADQVEYRCSRYSRYGSLQTVTMTQSSGSVGQGQQVRVQSQQVTGQGQQVRGQQTQVGTGTPTQTFVSGTQTSSFSGVTRVETRVNPDGSVITIRTAPDGTQTVSRGNNGVTALQGTGTPGNINPGVQGSVPHPYPKIETVSLPGGAGVVRIEVRPEGSRIISRSFGTQHVKTGQSQTTRQVFTMLDQNQGQANTGIVKSDPLQVQGDGQGQGQNPMTGGPFTQQ